MRKLTERGKAPVVEADECDALAQPDDQAGNSLDLGEHAKEFLGVSTPALEIC